MNRLITSCIVAVVAALGTTACSATPSDPASTTPTAEAAADPTTVAPTTADPEAAEPTSATATTPASESTSTAQSLSAACLSMAGPMAEANEKMQEITSVGTVDAQDAVDSWSALVEAYGSVAETEVDSSWANCGPFIKYPSSIVYLEDYGHTSLRIEIEVLGPVV